MPSDPRVDLEIDPILDAIDTATSTLSVCFKGVETLVITSFVGVDFLRAPCLAQIVVVAFGWHLDDRKTKL